LEVAAMPDGMQMSAEVMTAAGRDTGTVSLNLEAAMRRLLGDLEPLATEWRGSGGSTFQSLMTQLTNEYNRLIGALSTIADLTGTSSVRYVETDGELTDVVSRTTSMLGDGSITRNLM
jgi:WXG100 family type VII secretion target